MLFGFSAGLSSAKSIFSLVRFNTLVSYNLRKYLSKDPIHISAATARKQIKVPLQSKKKCGLKIKEQVFNFMIDNDLKNIVFPKTKTGKYKPFCYDQVDAYVIAKAGVLIENSAKS